MLLGNLTKEEAKITALPISHKTPAADGNKETHQGLNMTSRSTIEELLKNQGPAAYHELETNVGR